MVLMLWAHLLALVESWVLVHDVLDVALGEVQACLLPSLVHDLGEPVLGSLGGAVTTVGMD